MASRLSKFGQRIIVFSVAVFILVSVSSSSASQTRCYWCGPLAEQVHRSQRAPPCSTFHLEPHETVCDPGYSHCAIVATSPPYAESRLCVKFYQDECYSLYCNSTKTWRMVCACQGDLCNGPHTQRENEAFALVPKFAKNKSRNKRSTNFIKTKNAVEENAIIIMGKTPNDAEALNDQPTEDKAGEQATSPTDDQIKVAMTPTPKKAEDNYMVVYGSLTNIEKNDTMKTESNDVSKKDIDPTMPNKKDKHLETTKISTYIVTTKMDTHNDPNMNKAGENATLNDTKVESEESNDVSKKDIEPTMPDMKGKNLETTKMDTYIETTKMDTHNDPNMNKAGENATLNDTKVESEVSDEKINNHTNTETNKYNPENNKTNTQTDKPLEIPTKSPESKETTITSTKQITIEMSVAVQYSVTPGKMPPAENLQQNTTPTKAIEVTTMGSVVTTESHIVETTTSVNNDTQKNGEKQNLAHAMVFVVCLIAKYCV